MSKSELSSSEHELMELAIGMALMSQGSDDEKNKENPLLQMLLMALLAGSPEAAEMSPMEQAQMIHEMLSSGQQGGLSQLAGQGGAGMTYGATGAMAAAAPVGGMVSVSA